MANNQNEPVRPPRSLRDRSASRSTSSSDLPPTDYINTEKNDPVNEKPEDFDEQAKSYLSQFDEDEDEEENPLTVSKEEKPKVQVLNLREKRISTEKVKKETKEKIKVEVEKVKEEIHKVEEVVEETKEEVKKIGSKISENAEIYKAKIIAFGLKTFESVQDFIMGKIFKRRTKATPEKTENKSEKKSKQKVIPKVKYASLLAKKIEFFSYDKKPLVNSTDTGVLLEQIFISNTISDVQYCIKYVTDLPLPDKGIYTGRKITEIFENVTPEDINLFLYYVQCNPEPFIGNNYKFSEAFATWIIRKSHEI